MASGNSMKSRYGSSKGSFAAVLQNFSDDTKEQMDEIFRGCIIGIGSSLVMLTPVDTGRARANWQFSIEGPAMASLLETDKAGMETIAKLVGDVQNLTFGQSAWLVNNLRYSIPLEYGHSKQAPNGMVRVTITKFNQILDQAVREVIG